MSGSGFAFVRKRFDLAETDKTLALHSGLISSPLPGRLYPMACLTDDVTFRRLARARDFLAAGYNERIPLERAAREACLSPFHFQRMFARVFGETPHEFVTRLRMDTAKRLLASGEMPVTDVCLEVGYSSVGTFSARFAAQIGRAPSEYRRQ